MCILYFEFSYNMAEIKNDNNNPILPDITTIEYDSRSFLLNQRNALRPLNRTLARNPRITRELEQQGGLNNLLTRTPRSEQERNYLSSFNNLQTAIFVDRLTNGDLNNVPSLETFAENQSESNTILTGVAQKLEDCCADLANKIKELQEDIKERFKKLRLLIIDFREKVYSAFDSVATLVVEANELVLEELNGLTDKIIDNNNKKAKNIKDFVDNNLVSADSLFQRNLLERYYVIVKDLNEIIKNLKDAETNIKTKINDKSKDIKDKIHDSNKELYDNIKDKINEFEGQLSSKFDALKTFISNELVITGDVILQGIESYYSLTLLPLLGSILGELSDIIVVVNIINKTVDNILNHVKKLPQKFEKIIDKKIDKFKDFLKEWKKELIKEIAEEVSLQIVGESYYKWDSTSTYYPTITFMFREIECGKLPRRCQIKMRLKKKNEELEDKDIEIIKTKALVLKNLKYNYGIQRYNYVSSDKRFKTTIFGEQTSEIKELLKTLFNVINEPFEEKNLSITQQRLRENLTKIKTALNNIQINNIDYNQKFKVVFKKAVLLINGMSQPIIIAQN